MKNKMKHLVLITIALFLSSTFIYAQHNEEHSKHESHNHYSKHHVALFNGATTNFSHELTSYTIGIDYEYRLSKFIGIGFLGEYITSKPEEFLTGVGVIAHPFKGIRLLATPLMVYAEENNNEGNDVKKETSFSFRIGTGYDFHIGKLSVGPSINYDFGNTNAISFGITTGFGF